MKNSFLNEQETKVKLADFILNSKKMSMGDFCLEFESQFAAKQGRAYAVLFNSGGSANLALLQSLKNLDTLHSGDRVGFSALTWSTNVMPIFQLSMCAIPVDCSVETLNIMSESLIKVLEEQHIKTLFITNALGFTGDLSRIADLCKEYGVVLLEDNCESLGSVIDGRLTGNFGLASTFSFFVGHHISTIEGGMVCTDDAELAAMLKIVRANGWDRNLTTDQQCLLRERHCVKSEFQAKYVFYDLGFNLRPTEITGFLGIEQLRYLDQTIDKREENYLKLEKYIKLNEDFLPLSHEHIDKLSTFAIPIVCKSERLRNIYIKRFLDAGIEVRPMIAGNIQLQPFFKKYSEFEYELPGANFLHGHSFYCGNYPELTDADIGIIITCLSNGNCAGEL